MGFWFSYVARKRWCFSIGIARKTWYSAAVNSKHNGWRWQTVKSDKWHVSKLLAMCKPTVSRSAKKQLHSSIHDRARQIWAATCRILEFGRDLQIYDPGKSSRHSQPPQILARVLWGFLERRLWCEKQGIWRESFMFRYTADISIWRFRSDFSIQ